jgi:hypothetical protein
MKKLIKKITFWINSLYNTWYFKHMCKKADKQMFITGKRHWVVPVGEKLKVINKDWLNTYNKMVEKGQRIDIYQLSKIAYYETGQGTLRKRNFKKHEI